MDGNTHSFAYSFANFSGILVKILTSIFPTSLTVSHRIRLSCKPAACPSFTERYCFVAQCKKMAADFKVLFGPPAFVNVSNN